VKFSEIEIIPCLNHGFVALVDVMGSDRTAAQCARTSFRNAQQERTEEQDAKLTDYLVRNNHNTPLEFCQLRFYVKMPIFVARQLVRHRTQSINEVSYRYVQAAREFYIPDVERCQRKAETNKQGSSSALVDNPALVRNTIEYAGNHAFDAYENLLAAGLAPELARTVLPCGTYTEWYSQSNLHNFLHMAGLRTDPHAQYEVRVFAEAMLALAEPHFPTAVAAWRKKNGL
jgi:thymidylate synthase (FAD)